MTQTLYALMNKIKILKKFKDLIVEQTIHYDTVIENHILFYLYLCECYCIGKCVNEFIKTVYSSYF
jgi:hypothetical protein